MLDKTLIPAAVREEFVLLVKESKGYEAKRAAARKRVYSRLVGMHGARWWNLNAETLKTEMTNIEEQVTSGEVKVIKGNRVV